MSDLRDRVDARIRVWRVAEERRIATASSVIVFGRRHGQPVVVKVIEHGGDEWKSGRILDAFDGHGVVRVYDYVDGALLLEQLSPGHAVATVVANESDDAATAVLADVIRRMAPRTTGAVVPTVQHWGEGFARYLGSGDDQLQARLVQDAHRTYAKLCASQTRVRLLHGDLQHYNVLFDAGRGWVAVDPKGVVGELEYEIGAALRNPYDRPRLFADPSIVRKRIERFVRELGLDAARVASWAFAQAVLSAIWSVEDGSRVAPEDGRLTLASTLRRMTGGSPDA